MKIKVNGHRDYNIQISNDDFNVNGEPILLDARKLSSGLTHILYKNKSYNVQLVSEDRAEKSCVVNVNGNKYHISMEDQYDQLLKQLGMDSTSGNKVKDIKAPMPGLVLNVFGKEGMEVDKGENILVLEAMKMENIIKSPSTGKIAKILVNSGDKVEKNQVLVQFD
jgi:biotin carboxyl carrier protein